jgi:hypothetical protein
MQLLYGFLLTKHWVAFTCNYFQSFLKSTHITIEINIIVDDRTILIGDEYSNSLNSNGHSILNRRDTPAKLVENGSLVQATPAAKPLRYLHNRWMNH